MDINETTALNDGAADNDGAAIIYGAQDNDGAADIDGAQDNDRATASTKKAADKTDAEKFSFSQIHKYLYSGTYPITFDKPDKQALRKRSKYFKNVDGNLYYVGGGKHIQYTVYIQS